MNQIAQSLYITRLQKGLSQKQLALKAGIPQPNLSQIEKGRDFKVSTLYQLALALQVPVEDLFMGVTPIPLNKKIFFQRDNIERVVDCIAQEKVLPRKLKQIAELVAPMIGVKKRKGYVRRGELYVSWAKLKSTFSGEEIRTIFSRVEKARRRLA